MSAAGLDTLALAASMAGLEREDHRRHVARPRQLMEHGEQPVVRPGAVPASDAPRPSSVKRRSMRPSEAAVGSGGLAGV